jgi:hypothetical protein
LERIAGGKVGDVCKDLSKLRNVEAVGKSLPWKKIARDIGTDESLKGSLCVHSHYWSSWADQPGRQGQAFLRCAEMIDRLRSQ